MRLVTPDLKPRNFNWPSMYSENRTRLKKNHFIPFFTFTYIKYDLRNSLRQFDSELIINILLEIPENLTDLDLIMGPFSSLNLDVLYGKA